MKAYKRPRLIGLCEAIELYGREVVVARPRYTSDGQCHWCGKPISVKRRICFCNKDCSMKFNAATSSVYYVNKGSRGGYANHILRRDNYTCQNCGEFHGIINEHNIPLPTTDGELEIHHIIRVCDGGADNPDNLVTLCKECHKRMHTQVVEEIEEVEVID